MKASMSVPRKIHIVPVGFEVERIVRPLKYLTAEKVYLIIEKDEIDNSYIKNIQKLLKKTVDVEIKPVSDFWDYEENMKQICSLLYEEIHINDNPVWINLSSGSKLHSTIGLTAIQMFGFFKGQQKAFPYYIKAKDYRKDGDNSFEKLGSAVVPEITDSNAIDFIISPSVLPTERPGIKELELMQTIDTSPRTKADKLRDLMEDEQLNNATKAKAARLIRLVGPLLEKGLIESEGRTRSTRYKLTSKGKSYLRSFGSLVSLYKQKPKFE